MERGLDQHQTMYSASGSHRKPGAGEPMGCGKAERGLKKVSLSASSYKRHVACSPKASSLADPNRDTDSAVDVRASWCERLQSIGRHMTRESNEEKGCSCGEKHGISVPKGHSGDRERDEEWRASQARIQGGAEFVTSEGIQIISASIYHPALAWLWICGSELTAMHLNHLWPLVLSVAGNLNVKTFSFLGTLPW